ncbi:MAG TPA: response regulator [Aggregatilinea sp.]|jgi:DNA-binding response OmpR family regulator|uniref:response regulator transcription factor n=1 Tax=Aggregatilinea sp. TaxID=2806333 RepID=UPI002BDC0D42|nr:response regulator [Aggregatilinea sp.]HML21259.1 response regulator [Aggregatilinea sp.]
MPERILVVDDDPLLCSLLEMALGREGYQTSVVYSGRAALDILEKESFDLILLDIMMADLNGFDVIRQIQASPKSAAIPVIFLTARVDAISQRIGMDAGAVEYLTKPITPDDLISRVKATLASRS